SPPGADRPRDASLPNGAGGLDSRRLPFVLEAHGGMSVLDALYLLTGAIAIMAIVCAIASDISDTWRRYWR
ncbi:MAG TPA: hypothetical protein VKO62_01660, partial [Solirubrobacterales bacterium]|nr:hypothetical protein [Solirubrobacterales bacterium]